MIAAADQVLSIECQRALGADRHHDLSTAEGGALNAFAEDGDAIQVDGEDGPFAPAGHGIDADDGFEAIKTFNCSKRIQVELDTARGMGANAFGKRICVREVNRLTSRKGSHRVDTEAARVGDIDDGRIGRV